jgi:hypothetical protein
MLHEVFGHEGEALLRADQRLDARPLSLEPILLGLGFVLGQIGYFGVDLGPLVLVKLSAPAGFHSRSGRSRRPRPRD